MNLLRCTLDRFQPVPDSGQFMDQVLGFINGGGPGRLDNARKVCATVLPDMLVGVTESALVVARKLWKESDDLACVSPVSENDQSFLFVHRLYPRRGDSCSGGVSDFYTPPASMSRKGCAGVIAVIKP
jgi:hypothetical protein